MLTKPTLALVTFFFVIGTMLGAASSKELPMHAVVDGHPVQPTESQLQAMGHPDITTSEAKEVTNLSGTPTEKRAGNAFCLVMVAEGCL
jgi:hypothetical protein